MFFEGVIYINLTITAKSYMLLTFGHGDMQRSSHLGSPLAAAYSTSASDCAS